MVPTVKSHVGIYPQTAIERLKDSNGGDIGMEKQRLRKATKEFESLFMYEMLKTMRKTIPGDDSSENNVFSTDLGKDTYTQMFDMELARKLTSGGQGSIADMLYNSLERVIADQPRSESSPVKIKALNQAETKLTTLDREQKNIPLHRLRPVSMLPRTPGFVPIRSVTASRSQDPIISQFGRYIEEAAQQTLLDSSLIYAVIKTESDGDPRAISQVGAKGLMQLADSTVQDYNVSQVFDPRENILAGSKYLRDLVDRFGNLELALAAYNAGPRNVERHDGVPPFKETRAFVDRVMRIVASHNRTLPEREAKVSTGSDR